MDKVYLEAFDITIGHEGGLVNDPDDPGGKTKYGISQRSYPDVDIASLTLRDAQEIYYKDFWVKQSCHLMLDTPDIAIELFDTSVNTGVGKGARIFQEALNLSNRAERDYQDIAVDGSIGAKTISALRANKFKRLMFNIMNALQGEWYIILMRKREINEKYIGWFDRLDIKKKPK